jgi:hypothetical protein
MKRIEQRNDEVLRRFMKRMWVDMLIMRDTGIALIAQAGRDWHGRGNADL